MNSITRNCLRVQSLTGLVDFYSGLLGMKCVEREGNLFFGYPSRGCRLEFLPVATQPYQEQNNNQYWKSGITLRDLDAAVFYLRQQGLDVPEPRQFADIGYLSHIRDPQGFVIELLQQGFKGNSQPVPAGHAIGAQATLAHITLRVSDIQASRDFYEQTLSMRLMSIQPVEDYGFCLYFYAWSDEELPNPDLASVENREWLWSRPYTLIELQHLATPGSSTRKNHPQQSGFDGFSFADFDLGKESCRNISYADIPG